MLKYGTFCRETLKYGIFCRKTLKYGIFCRETLKYGTFCRKTLKYALRENNSKWREVPRKPHNLCCPGIHYLSLANILAQVLGISQEDFLRLRHLKITVVWQISPQICKFTVSPVWPIKHYLNGCQSFLETNFCQCFMNNFQTKICKFNLLIGLD